MEGIIRKSPSRQLPVSDFQSIRENLTSHRRASARSFLSAWTPSNRAGNDTFDEPRCRSLLLVDHRVICLWRIIDHPPRREERERWKNDGGGGAVERVMELAARERSQREGRNYVIAVSLRSGNSIS